MVRARRALPVLAAVIALACAAAVPSLAAAAPARVPIGGAPELPQRAVVTGTVSEHRVLHVTLGLAPRDPAGLQALVAAVTDPGSPRFRHYLTVRQFAARFGAPPARVAAVRRALRAAGLSVGAPYANALTLPVSGTADTVARAFATRLASVRLADGRQAFSDTVAPTLSSSIAGDVDAVIGLDDLHVPAPTGALARPGPGRTHGAAVSHVVTGGPQPCAAATAATASDLSYTADQTAAAYGFSGLYGAGDLGAGQTIGVYELEPIFESDVAAYQSCFGTSAPVSYVTVDHPAPVTAKSDDTEAALDVEQVIGLAPRAHVVVYEAPDDGQGGIDLYSKIFSQDTAKVVSVSWGACEQYATSDGGGSVQEEARLFQEAALQGQSVFAATGDQGSAACTGNDNGSQLSVQDPSTQPNVTAVGATSLYTMASGTPVAWSPGQPLSEGVWNDGTDPSTGQPVASTGGVSILWGMPSYQSTAAAGLGLRNVFSANGSCGRASCREVPDVSANGDPNTGYVVFTNGAWNVVGGTSAATPVWGTIAALANALPACRGVTVGFADPSLYRLASAGYATYFRDITAGTEGDPADNDALGLNGGLYPATGGFDLATGLGVPNNAAAIAAAMCAQRAPVYTITVAAPGSRTATLRTAYRLTVQGTDSGRAPLVWSATGLPPGLTIASATGVISGTPTRAGVFPVTVRARDDYANASETAFTLTVATPPPRFSGVSLTGVAARRPRLRFTASKGEYSPALSAVTVTPAPGLTVGGSGSGIRVTAGGQRLRFSSRRSHGVLTIRFRRAQSKVTVAIAGPAIAAAPALQAAARSSAATVVIGLTALDRRGLSTPYLVRLHLRK